MVIFVDQVSAHSFTINSELETKAEGGAKTGQYSPSYWARIDYRGVVMVLQLKLKTYHNVNISKKYVGHIIGETQENNMNGYERVFLALPRLCKGFVN